ncbi:MAG: hypothetical protein ABSC22_17735 [Roseiarcus sp.]
MTVYVDPNRTEGIPDGYGAEGQGMRARDRAADELLVAAIRSTLRYGVASRVAVGDSPGEGDFGVRIVPVAIEDDEPFQLLRAVAIFEPPGETTFGGATGLN